MIGIANEENATNAYSGVSAAIFNSEWEPKTSNKVVDTNKRRLGKI
tara:strand:- start:646 stop:783 length:138 start_codon:yes stop_codon:yes gene_type:complete